MALTPNLSLEKQYDSDKVSITKTDKNFEIIDGVVGEDRIKLNTLESIAKQHGNEIENINEELTNKSPTGHNHSTDDIKNGTLPVSRGGTGKNTLPQGSVVTGNGTNGVNSISGTGALYATTSGAPNFGTLPPSCGGTGLSDLSGTGLLSYVRGIIDKLDNLPVSLGGTGCKTLNEIKSVFGIKDLDSSVGALNLLCGSIATALTEHTENADIHVPSLAWTKFILKNTAGDIVKNVTIIDTEIITAEPAYRKLFGKVELRGQLEFKWSNNDLLIATLPDGYRPSEGRSIPFKVSYNQKQLTHLVIGTNGNLVIQKVYDLSAGKELTSGSYTISLEGVSFAI